MSHTKQTAEFTLKNWLVEPPPTPHHIYRVFRRFRSKEREIKQVWLSHRPGPGSCSPHGWASCLLGMLGAFLSGALSAEAGLYLRSMCQGEYSDRAKLVKKLLLNLTLCGWTQRTNNVMLKSKLRALKQNVPIFFFFFLKAVTGRFRRKDTTHYFDIDSRAQSHRRHDHVVVNVREFTQLTR